MNCYSVITLAAALIGFSAAALAHGEKIDPSAPDPIVLAPGYERLDYPAPKPGTYQLADIGPAGNGRVLQSTGEVTQLHTVFANKITVLSFIYRACNDVNGCPLATFVMHQLRDKLESEPSLADQVQLVSMSFDPAHDTPAAMASYAASFGESAVPWSFLTAPSVAELREILSAYDQSISPVDDETEGDANVIKHMLRVYVIDADSRIRNIYSSSLLHADTLISDIKTLAMEEQIEGALEQVVAGTDDSVLNSAKPADDRSGYASGEYVSRSRRLQVSGTETDLLALATQAIPGLPKVDFAAELSQEKISLGRRLFFDRRLSINDTFSCAMCHAPEQAFTINELATAVGVEGRTVKRNAPSLINVGFLKRLFHDGREYSLEQQVWSPLLAHNEMANPSIGYVINKIAAIDQYGPLFQKAFGSTEPTMQRIGEALAAYQRVLIAGNAPFDQWYFAGDETAVSASVKTGFELFSGKAGCARCHLVADEFALFTDEQMHNTGVGYAKSMRNKREPHPVTLAPGVVVQIDPAVYADAAETPPNDLGLYEVTQNPADRWKFRTAGLRNIALTAPYMHDGSISDLAGVIDFYVEGGVPNPELSPLIQPLDLSESERAALLDFLNSLTSSEVNTLISDAKSVPVGDIAGTERDWRASYVK